MLPSGPGTEVLGGSGTKGGKFMFKTLIAAATLGAALVPAAVSATVLSFDGASGSFSQLAEQGYKVTGALYADNGAVANSASYGKITVARVDGAAFTLASLQVADNYRDLFATNIDVYFDFVPVTGASFTYDYTINAGPNATFETLSPTNVALKSFSIYNPQSYGFGYIKIDNVTVNAVAAAVPEPATWAMMVIGFGIAGAAVRRRKVSVRFA